MADEWAVLACRAYNNWLYDRFLNKNSRLKGMALLPLQNVEDAALELRRAVKELGMLGGMLPSNGEAIQGHLGKRFIGHFTKRQKSSAALSRCMSVAFIIWAWILLAPTTQRTPWDIRLA